MNSAGLVHTRRSFEFVVQGRWDTVAPLFGALGERSWAPDWAPRILWPAEARDCEGMVFVTRHGQAAAVWINTRLDLQAGRFQYVYVIPDTLATLISVQLGRRADGTSVAVEYQRTALCEHANAQVQQMADHDAAAGPEWEAQINTYLARQPGTLSGLSAVEP